MKTIITAATLLIASSTVSAAWDMPFFGNGSNANNGAFGGNSITDTAGNGVHKGNGSADGEGEFSFSMSFKGRGTAKMDTASTSDWKGNGNFNADTTTASNSQTETQTNYAPYGYNPNNVAPAATPKAPVTAK